MSKKLKKTTGSVIYDLVHEWTRSEDKNRLKRNVDEWTKPKSSKGK